MSLRLGTGVGFRHYYFLATGEGRKPQSGAIESGKANLGIRNPPIHDPRSCPYSIGYVGSSRAKGATHCSNQYVHSQEAAAVPLLVGYFFSCIGFTVIYSLFGYMGWSREGRTDSVLADQRLKEDVDGFSGAGHS